MVAFAAVLVAAMALAASAIDTLRGNREQTELAGEGCGWDAGSNNLYDGFKLSSSKTPVEWDTPLSAAFDRFKSVYATRKSAGNVRECKGKIADVTLVIDVTDVLKPYPGSTSKTFVHAPSYRDALTIKSSDSAAMAKPMRTIIKEALASFNSKCSDSTVQYDTRNLYCPEPFGSAYVTKPDYRFYFSC